MTKPPPIPGSGKGQADDASDRSGRADVRGVKPSETESGSKIGLSKNRTGAERASVSKEQGTTRQNSRARSGATPVKTGPGGGNGKSKKVTASGRLRSGSTFRPMKTSRSFGRFRLLMEMAKGGMATLYLARLSGPEQFEKLLVLKKIHDHLAEEAEFVSMFLDEARITALIHHPNVVTIFDMGQVDGSYFIAMDYVHGENMTVVLRAAVRQKKGFGWPYAARIVADAAAGLHAAHELRGPDGRPLGVVHRDVSPQNILVSYDGNTQVVDFGIAYAAERITHTTAGTLKGKVAYMSPEQTGRNDLDRRSDIFSLGIVLYESVCLRRLFKEGSEAASLLRIREADVPKPRSIRPSIPADLEAIILKALAKNPDDRFSTAQEMAERLNRLLVKHGHVVGQPQIAKFMDGLFYQKRKLKDEQIQQAIKSVSDQPEKGFGMAGTSTKLETSLPAQTLLPTNVQGQGLGKPLVAAAGLLAGGLVILAVVLALRHPAPSRQSQAPKKSPVHQIAPPMEPPRPRSVQRDAAVPRQVTLKVVIRPERARATVLFRGKKYPGSVFQISVVRSAKQEVLKVEAPGFKAEILALVPTEDKEVILTLKPRHRVRKPPRPRDGLPDLP